MKNINKKFLLCAKTPHNLMLHGVNVGDPAEIRTPDTLLKRQVLCRLSYWIMLSWNGRDGWIRTSECRRQRPMPYRLATPPYSFARNSVTLKITRCVRSASQGYMGWVKGLEPSTLGTTIRCSNQLSYTHHINCSQLERWHARRDSNPRPTA